MRSSRTMNTWKKWSSNSMKTVPTFGWAAWTTLSTGDEATLFGRLLLRPVVAVLSSWQWVLPGMISPVSGLK